MILTSNSILVQRSIDVVFRFVAEDFFENYCKWSPEVVEVDKLTAGEMCVGVTGWQVRNDGGYRSEALFEVTRYEPLRELRFVSRSKPAFEVAYLFTVEDEGSRLTFKFRLELPLLMRPWHSRIRDRVERGGRQIVHNLKELLEAEPVATSRNFTVPAEQTGSAAPGPVSDRGFRD